ncbi:MAG: lipoyl(octanoyl) transferase LipB, partial [Chloroflexi bacterium]|nr:lipoyl(octanoyl) transferase LipB [Chloroflexota bacterium]
MSAAAAPLALLRPGRLDYGEAWELQEGLKAARQRGLVEDTLILLEHPPTYTLGRRGRWKDVLLSEGERARRGVAVFEVDRGGEVTYHGPGQLVGYPIVDLRGRGLDAHRYVHGLEDILIGALADVGLEARILPGIVGVWVGF